MTIVVNIIFDLQDGIDGVGDGRDVGDVGDGRDVGEISVPVAMIMNTIQVSIMTRGE